MWELDKKGSNKFHNISDSVTLYKKFYKKSDLYYRTGFKLSINITFETLTAKKVENRTIIHTEKIMINKSLYQKWRISIF